MLNLNDVERILKGVALMHLNGEELGAYHDNTVDEIDRSLIEAHLARRLICKRRLATIETLAVYPQEPVTDEDIARAKILLYRQEIVAMLRTVLPVAFAAWIRQHRIRVALAGARATGPSEPQYGQTEYGTLHWDIVADESGALVVRFSSHHKELEKVKLLLKAGPIEKAVVLEPVLEDQVGAEVIFTRKERAQLSEDVQLTIGVKP